MPGDDIAGLVAAAAGPAADSSSERRAREKALATLVPALARSAKRSGFRAVAAGRWIVELVIELAPQIPVRDADTLRRQYPGVPREQLAARLVKTAASTTAGIGAAAGGLAAVEFVSPPLLLATPVQLAAEVLTITAVELKLVAELHELFDRPAPGSVSDRAGAYLTAWSSRHAASPELGGAGIGVIVGVTARRELRSQLMRRLGRSTASLGPFLTGAVAGAEINRRATKALGQALVAELSALPGQRPVL